MAIPSDAMAAPTPLPSPLIPRIARIRTRRKDSRDVWTLDMEEEIQPQPSFQPGQFNMVTVFGVGEIPISISGDPARPERLIHTVRSVGPVSAALTELRAGDPVGLRGPFGQGWPVESGEGLDILVMAGGLGLAPLRPALYRLRAERKRYGRVNLLYGTRSPEDILFARELESWRRNSQFDVHITVDHATSSWKGNVGVVTTLLSRAGYDPKQTMALICGPEVMMRASIAALCAAGVPGTAIHLSMERNMKCAVALCGRCQFSRVLVCRDGPVFRYDRVGDLLTHREI